MGSLFLVGTPLGNLEDITLRALRILREVPLIAAEDTRHARRLLDHYEIQVPLISYFEHNERARVDLLLGRLAEGDLALITDAGMPGISDPGYELVRVAIEAGFAVVPIPGPSAPIAALAASGLPTDQFVYLGFLPRRSGDRRRLLREVAAERRTLIAFEAPHRLLGTLTDLRAELGDRRLVIGRELTKLHEEFARGTVSEVQRRFEEVAPRGELTLVVAGAMPNPAPRDFSGRIAELVNEGMTSKEIVAAVTTELGVPRRQVYQALLGARKCAKIE